MKQHLKKTVSVLLSVCMVLCTVAVGLVVSKVPAQALSNSSGQQWIYPYWVTATSINAAENLIGGTSGTYYYDPSTGGYGIGSNYPLSWSAQAACASNGEVDFFYRAYVNINGSYYGMSDGIINVDQNSQQYCISSYTNTQTASGTYYITVPSQGNSVNVTFYVYSRMWHANGANLESSTSVTLTFVTNCTHSNASALVRQYDGSTHWDHCNVCGSNINSTGHSFDTLVDITQGATCTSNAYGTYKCTGCDQTTANKEVPDTQLDHTYTYTSNGNDTHAIGCANCTYSASGNCEYQFNGFAWAANEESAQVNLKCSKCLAEKQVNAAMSSDVHPAHCMDNAYTIFTASYEGHTDQRTVIYQGTAPGHTYIYTSNGNGTHTITCANCEYTDSANCGYEITQHAPTATTGAYTTYECSACHYSYDTVEITSYPVTFVVEGVETVLNFNYGSTPAYPGVPAKAADAKNYYAFAGWDKALSPVTGEEEYVAVFNAIPYKYLVRATAGAGSTVTDVTGIYTYNDTVDFTVTVAEGYTGTPVVSVNGTPVEAAAANGSAYDYSVTVTGNTEITVADLTKQTFTVKFDVDGAETEKTVAYGDTPTPGFTPVKAADAQYRYTFTGWDPAIVPAVADATYTAQFDSETRSYPVYVKGGAGSEISIASGTRDYGTELNFDVTVNEGYAGAPTVTVNNTNAEAVSSANGVYSYSVTVTGETEIAVSDLTKNTYTITFDVDGTTTEKTVAYGDLPAFNGNPEKAATAQYSYTFTGWDTAIVPATADATYTAQFDPVLRSYPISFATPDGANTILVSYGATPEPGVTPAKAADATNYYTFREWNTASDGSGDGISSVTGMETYYAIFDATPIPADQYFVSATAGAGTAISDITGLYADGATVSFDVTVAEGYDPTGLVVSVNGTAIDNPAPVNGVYSYTLNVNGNKTVTVSDLTKYTYEITFAAGDETVTRTVTYGEVPAYGKTPVKAATAQYTYTFTDWDEAIVPAAAAKTYTAQFSETLRRYPVFVNPGVGSEISITSGMQDYGTTLDFTVTVDEAYNNAAPVVTVGDTVINGTKNGNVFSYSVTVLNDVEISVGDLTKNDYTVAFKNGTADLGSVTAAYGVAPVYAGETPVYSGEAGTTYTFLGWTDEAKEPGAAATYYTVLPAADGNATYYAYFGAQTNTYTVDFVIDGQTISKTFPYGATPALGYTPVKAADASNTYTFSGWTPAVETVTGDATYTAVFDPTPIPVTPTLYLVKARAGEGTKINDVTGLYEANDTVTLTVSVDEAYSQRTPTVNVNGATLRVVDPVSGVYTYTVTVEGATDITVSDLSKNTYDVAFKDYDGSPLDTVTVEWGEDAAYPGSNPIRPADENYVYTFTGWDVSLNNIKADTEAKAVYQQTPVGSHTHQFTVNSFDETGHWMACACGERQDFAAHVTQTKHDATGHWTECACGYKTAKENHVFSEEIGSGEATCVSPAYTVTKCACGETKRTESGDVDPTKHAGEIKTFGAREATETAEGYTGDKYCLACGDLVEAGTVINKTHVHSYDTEVESAPATCVAKAYTIYECSCGDRQKVETGEVNANNHAGEIRLLGAREATETVDGYTGDKYCLACGDLVEAGAVIPHTGTTTPENPTQPDTPDDNGGSHIRISILDWLRNLIKKILALFRINTGSDESVC